MEKYLTTKQLEDFRTNVLPKYKMEKNPLMQVLQEAQSLFGCVPYELQQTISETLNESTAKINGVVTFYSMFSVKPMGKNILGVCTGTACYVKGSSRLVDRVSEYLNTPYGKTTDDGLFTLSDTRCVGACSMAPVIMVNEKIYGNVSSDDVTKIIEEYIKK